MYEVTVKGLEKCVTEINDLADVLKNPERVYDAVGFAMKSETQLLFREGKDIDGKSFEPSIRARTEGGKTLVDTGALRNSIDYLASSRGVEWGAAVGPTEHRARIHNFGGTIKASKKRMLKFQLGKRWVFKSSVFMPRRQFIGFNDRYEKLVRETIVEFLEGEFK